MKRRGGVCDPRLKSKRKSLLIKYKTMVETTHQSISTEKLSPTHYKVVQAPSCSVFLGDYKTVE